MQLYLSNKTEHFSYKDGCGKHERTGEELAWAIGRRLQVIIISSKIFFNTIIPPRN